MFNQIIETAVSQDIFEWCGLIFGIIYVLLAAKEKAICWVFGILSCSLIAFKDITSYKLYADAGLQIFYILMGFWGLFEWFRKGTSSSGESINHIKSLHFSKHLIALVSLTILAIPLGWLLNQYTDASFSYLDSITTLFAIFATVLLVKKYLENWLYWIVIDIVYVYLYANQSGYMFALLSLIYTLIAIYGYQSWKRSIDNQRITY